MMYIQRWVLTESDEPDHPIWVPVVHLPETRTGNNKLLRQGKQRVEIRPFPHWTGHCPTQILPQRVNLQCPSPHLRVLHLGQEAFRLGDIIRRVHNNQIPRWIPEVLPYEALQVNRGNCAISGPGKRVEGLLDLRQAEPERQVDVELRVKVLWTEGGQGGVLQALEEGD